jgi:hypothetical protein
MGPVHTVYVSLGSGIERAFGLPCYPASYQGNPGSVELLQAAERDVRLSHSGCFRGVFSQPVTIQVASMGAFQVMISCPSVSPSVETFLFHVDAQVLSAALSCVWSVAFV